MLVYFVTIATTGAVFSLQFAKNRLAAGLCPDPLGELKPSPRSTSKGRGMEGREGDRMGGKRREGRGEERRGQQRRVGGGKVIKDLQ